MSLPNYSEKRKDQILDATRLMVFREFLAHPVIGPQIKLKFLQATGAMDDGNTD